MLFWNKFVDVPALISCWKNTFLVTLVITHFRSSTKKHAQKLSDNFLLSPSLKYPRKEKHFAKNQLCLCLQPLLLNFVLLNIRCVWVLITDKWNSRNSIYQWKCVLKERNYSLPGLMLKRKRELTQRGRSFPFQYLIWLPR